MPSQCRCILLRNMFISLITGLSHCWNACYEAGSDKPLKNASLDKHNVTRNQTQFSYVTDFPWTSVIFEGNTRAAKVTCNVKHLLKADSKPWLSKVVLISENCLQKLQWSSQPSVLSSCHRNSERCTAMLTCWKPVRFQRRPSACKTCSVFAVSSKAYFYILKWFLCVCLCVACNSICLKQAQKKRGLKHKAGKMPLSTPTLLAPKGKLLNSVVITRRRSYFRTWYFLYLKIKEIYKLLYPDSIQFLFPLSWLCLFCCSYAYTSSSFSFHFVTIFSGSLELYLLLKYSENNLFWE